MDLLFLDIPKRARSRGLHQVRNERGWQEAVRKKRARFVESEPEEEEEDNDDDEAILVGALFALRNSTGAEPEDDDREDRDEDLRQQAGWGQPERRKPQVKHPAVKPEHKRGSSGRGRSHRANHANDDPAWNQGMAAPQAGAGPSYGGDIPHTGPGAAFVGQGLGLGTFKSVMPSPGGPAYFQQAAGRSYGTHWAPEAPDALAVPSTSGQDRHLVTEGGGKFKRSASHVYIAHFISHQNELKRMQQAQVHAQQHPPGNGFPVRYASDAHKLPANGDLGPSRQSPPAGQDLLSNGVNHGLPAESSQALPSTSGSNPFLVPHSAGGHQIHSAALQGLPPAYAQLLSQQPNGFPFLPGVHLGGAFTAQQQQAAAQALANFPLFQSQLMGFPPGLQSQLAAVTSAANGSNGAPALPKAPLPAEVPELPKHAPQHANGSLKQLDPNAAILAKLGVPFAGLDMAKLKAMAPQFFDAAGNLSVPASLADGLKAARNEQPVMDNWGGGSMSMRL